MVLGNHTEFRRVVNLLLKTLDFDKDLNVSVFETNIRGKQISTLTKQGFPFFFTFHSSGRFVVSSLVDQASWHGGGAGLALFRTFVKTCRKGCPQATAWLVDALDQIIRFNIYLYLHTLQQKIIFEK